VAVPLALPRRFKRFAWSRRAILSGRLPFLSFCITFAHSAAETPVWICWFAFSPFCSWFDRRLAAVFLSSAKSFPRVSCSVPHAFRFPRRVVFPALRFLNEFSLDSVVFLPPGVHWRALMDISLFPLFLFLWSVVPRRTWKWS